jgi:hypothetical protein
MVTLLPDNVPALCGTLAPHPGVCLHRGLIWQKREVFVRGRTLTMKMQVLTPTGRSRTLLGDASSISIFSTHAAGVDNHSCPARRFGEDVLFPYSLQHSRAFQLFKHSITDFR